MKPTPITEILSWDNDHFNMVIYGAEIEWVVELQERMIEFSEALFTPGSIESYRRDRYDLHDLCVVRLRAIRKVLHGYHPDDDVKAVSA
jgi:hypothetical protein